jgi:hypothetical protein
MNPSFISTVVLLAVVNTTQAVVINGPVYNPANNHSYYLLGSDNWTGSQAQALGLGGNLVTINDAAENTFVVSSFLNYGGVSRDLWIGLSDAGHEGLFTWADGQAFSYSNWEPGQPDNGGGSFPESYVHIYGGTTTEHVLGWTPGRWNDAQNFSNYGANSGTTRQLFGVVEVVPEPSVSALLCVLGACCLWTGNRRSK